MKSLSCKKGYLLIESLVALALISFAIFFYSRLMMQCLYQLHTTRSILQEERHLYEQSLNDLEKARRKAVEQQGGSADETHPSKQEGNDIG